jgi:glycosyltransferase involved in cell wall biosynthesis
MYGKRNPEYLIKAVEELIAEGKVNKNMINLRFVGRFGNEVLQMFENENLKGCFEIINYLPHSESIKLILESEALLMIVDDFKGNEEIVPGKVFEYMGAKRPIITIAPEGAVTQLIRETKTGTVAGSNDVEQIKKIFFNYYRDYISDKPITEGNREEILKYERKEVTRQLAKIFDNVTKK